MKNDKTKKRTWEMPQIFDLDMNMTSGWDPKSSAVYETSEDACGPQS